MRLRVVLAVFACLAVLAVGGAFVLVHNLRHSLALPRTQDCTVTSGGQVTLDLDQMANAATIAAVGITRRMPERAVVVALATAGQESKWRNLSGGDRDSVGLFQQRPSQGWGTADQIADPRYAAGRFYAALQRVKGWQDMSVAVAAQHVQRSADGTSYARWEDNAQVLASALVGDTGNAVACTILDQPVVRGSAAAAQLTRTVALDWAGARVTATPSAGPPGVQLDVRDARSGWQVAHWLVAHAADAGIKAVSFGDQRWTPDTGAWRRTGSGPAAGGTQPAGPVTAEVYPQP